MKRQCEIYYVRLPSVWLNNLINIFIMLLPSGSLKLKEYCRKPVLISNYLLWVREEGCKSHLCLLVFCQLDTCWSHLKGGTSIGETVLIRSDVGHFLNYWLMGKAKPNLVSTIPGLVYQLLPLGSSSALVPVLSLFSDRLWCGSEGGENFSTLSCFWS